MAAQKSVFDILFLIGRPEAGKSEIIDYLKHSDIEGRRSEFRIGEFREIDDFPMLWAWFEDDVILSRRGMERLHSILEHSLEDEKLRRLYGEVVWQEFAGGDPEYLQVSGVKIPYRVFDNHDDVTTGRGTNPELGRRLRKELTGLWEVYLRR